MKLVWIFFAFSLVGRPSVSPNGAHWSLLPQAQARGQSSDMRSELQQELKGLSKKARYPSRKPAQQEPELDIEPEKPTSLLNPSEKTVITAEPERSSEIDIKIEQTQRLYDAKKYKEAAEVLKPFNDRLPRAGLLLMARIYSAMGDSLSEIRMLELCLAKNPKDYVVKTVFGQTLIRIKRIEDGVVAFQEARQLNPRYRPAYDALIKELESKGERYEARNVVNDMIAVFGPQGAFLTTLCRLYSLDSFHEKSVEICTQAIKKDASVPENHMYLGLALKEREDLEGANQILSRAIRRFPKSEPVQFAMGELHMAKKDFARAYKFFKSAAQGDAKSVRAWIGYANASIEIQKNEEALNAFLAACKIDRQQTKDFRLALGKIRVRKDADWQSRFESGINQCQE
jgi:tetratricopeptide (TPR) repeat protein